MSTAQQTNQAVLKLHIRSQFQCLTIRLVFLDRILFGLRHEIGISVQDDLCIGLIRLSHFEENGYHFSIVDGKQCFVCRLLMVAFVSLADFSDGIGSTYLCQQRIIQGSIGRFTHARLNISQLVCFRQRKKGILHRFLDGRNLLAFFQQSTQLVEMRRFYHTRQRLISGSANLCIR